MHARTHSVYIFFSEKINKELLLVASSRNKHLKKMKTFPFHDVAIFTLNF